LDWLVNGAAVGRGPVRAGSAAVLAGMTDVLREWPAVYDLLPTYEAVKAEDGTTLAVRQLSGAPGGFRGRDGVRRWCRGRGQGARRARCEVGGAAGGGPAGGRAVPGL